MIKQQFNDILQKEMDRKDFLRHVGVAAAAIVGIPAILKALNQTGVGSPVQRNFGYGSSVYGGSGTRQTHT